MLKTYNWLITYWPAVALGLMVLAVIDATLSSLLSCHPISASPGGGADSKPNQEECTALHGPILVSLTWLLKGVHKYEGAFLAIFTVVLAVFTGRLWYSTEKLSIATKRLVEGAEDTAQRQLRAYIGLVSNAMNDVRQEFIITVRNSGQTPGLKVIPYFNMRWYAVDTDMPDDFDFADYPQPRRQSGPVSITPGQMHEWSFKIDWQKFEQFKSRQLGAFYLYGRFEYFDIFGEPRLSEFCYEAMLFPQGGGAFRVSNRHNEMT